MKTLIVYYSLNGNTAYAAERIADRIGADTLRLHTTKDYSKRGLKKFIQGGKSAMLAEKPELEDYIINISRYDHIVLGFPVWASNFASPLRTFIAQNRAKLRRKDISAFACQKGSGAEKALERLKKYLKIDSFDVDAVFVDPKTKHSRGTDDIIDEFSNALIDLGAGETAGQALLRNIHAAAQGVAKARNAEADFAEDPDTADDDTEKRIGAAVLTALEALSALGEKGISGVRGISKDGVRDYLSDWNYKKHAKLCTALYLSLYAFDMTVSYFICRKLLDKAQEKREEQ